MNSLIDAGNKIEMDDDPVRNLFIVLDQLSLKFRDLNHPYFAIRLEQVVNLLRKEYSMLQMKSMNQEEIVRNEDRRDIVVKEEYVNEENDGRNVKIEEPETEGKPRYTLPYRKKFVHEKYEIYMTINECIDGVYSCTVAASFRIPSEVESSISIDIKKNYNKTLANRFSNHLQKRVGKLKGLKMSSDSFKKINEIMEGKYIGFSEFFINEFISFVELLEDSSPFDKVMREMTKEYYRSRDYLLKRLIDFIKVRFLSIRRLVIKKFSPCLILSLDCRGLAGF